MNTLRSSLLILVAAVIGFALVGEANAQRGSLFKKIRDEITAKAKQQQTQQQQAKQQAQARSEGKTPTLAKPSPKAQQVKSTRNPGSKSRHQNQGYRLPNGQTPQSARSNAYRTPYKPTQRVPAQTSAPRPSQLTPPQSPALKGFGWILKNDESGKLIVARLDPRGNAARSGVRPGDLVVGAGGIEISSQEDFQQITQVIENGDQMEFNIVSRGQQKTLTIQYGEAAQAELVSENALRGSLNSSSAPGSANRQQREIEALRKLVAEQRATMARLRGQIEQLQFESKPAPAIPTGARSVVDGPVFNGPNDR